MKVSLSKKEVELFCLRFYLILCKSGIKTFGNIVRGSDCITLSSKGKS